MYIYGGISVLLHYCRQELKEKHQTTYLPFSSSACKYIPTRNLRYQRISRKTIDKPRESIIFIISIGIISIGIIIN